MHSFLRFRPIVCLLSRCFFFLSSSSCSFHRKFTLTHAIIISSQLKSCSAANDGGVIAPRQKLAAPVVRSALLTSVASSFFSSDSPVGGRRAKRVGKAECRRLLSEPRSPILLLVVVRQSSFQLLFIFNPCPDLFHITEELSRKHCRNVSFPQLLASAQNILALGLKPQTDLLLVRKTRLRVC